MQVNGLPVDTPKAGATAPDLQEWNGSHWIHRNAGGVAMRRGHAMAYDSQRSVTVIFGGDDTEPAGWGGVMQDTWEWNGNGLTQAASTGPSPRHGHAMTYDSQRGVVVLFGGTDNSSLLNDTWEWNGNDWTQVSATGPSPRYEHAMAV